MYYSKLRFGKQNFADSKAIRAAVFMKEQGFRNEFDGTDDTAWHIVIYDGSLPIATGRTFPQDASTYALGRIAVLREYRGKGIGAMVIEGLEQKLRELGITHIKLSAQTHAVGFYQKLGYYAYGEKYMDEFCEHIAMKKELSI